MPMCSLLIFVILSTDPTALLTGYHESIKTAIRLQINKHIILIYYYSFGCQMKRESSGESNFITPLPLQDPSGTAFPSNLFQLIVGLGKPEDAQVSFRWSPSITIMACKENVILVQKQEHK